MQLIKINAVKIKGSDIVKIMSGGCYCGKP